MTIHNQKISNGIRKIIIWVLPALFFLPVLVLAANLVPCGGPAPEQPCSFSDLTTMINAILKWFLIIAGPLAAIGMMWSGAKIIAHPDKPAEREAAMHMFRSIFTGILLVAGAWLIVYTIMNTFASGNGDYLRFFKP